MWELALVGARLLQFTSALILCGSSLFYLYGLQSHAPSSTASPLRGCPGYVLFGAACGVLLGSALWLSSQTVLLTGNPASAIDPATLWVVLSDTSFGKVNLLRVSLAALALAGLLWVQRPRRRWMMMTILGGAIAASFAWTGHGGIDEGIPGIIHLWADVLHLWAAAIWLGALAPLLILVLLSLNSKSEDEARHVGFALAAFSGIGTAVVSVLVISGLINSWFLIGPAQWVSLFSAKYGILLSLKLILFGLMLFLAALNRYRLTPRLTSSLEQEGQAIAALSALRGSLIAESGLGLLVIWLVSWLGTLEPPSSGM
jgi:putative copper resistance protein D